MVQPLRAVWRVCQGRDARGNSRKFRNEILQGRELFTGEMREAVTIIGAEIITRSEDKWNRTLDGLPIWVLGAVGARKSPKLETRVRFLQGLFYVCRVIAKWSRHGVLIPVFAGSSPASPVLVFDVLDRLSPVYNNFGAALAWQLNVQ